MSGTMELIESIVSDNETLVPLLPPRDLAFDKLLLLMLQSGDNTNNPSELSNLIKMLLIARAWAQENNINNGEEHTGLMSLINILAFKYNTISNTEEEESE